jgi:hypothetical protein
MKQTPTPSRSFRWRAVTRLSSSSTMPISTPPVEGRLFPVPQCGQTCVAPTVSVRQEFAMLLPKLVDAVKS